MPLLGGICMKLLTPNLRTKNIIKLTPYYFIKNGITTVFIDVDNTIIDPRTGFIIPDFKEWKDNLKENGIAICFVSNTNSERKRVYLKRELGERVIIKALKPLSIGFTRAINELGIEEKQGIAIIGDQVFTDVLRGNLYGLHTIQVDPVMPNTNNDPILNALEELYFCFKSNVPIIPEEDKEKVYTK
jgi:HAD superfamily phosphatase (TIGR01668 family)